MLPHGVLPVLLCGLDGVSRFFGERISVQEFGLGFERLDRNLADARADSGPIGKNFKGGLRDAKAKIEATARNDFQN